MMRTFAIVLAAALAGAVGPARGQELFPLEGADLSAIRERAEAVEAPAAEVGAQQACQDPFEPDGIIPSGRYKGQRIDTAHIRSAQVLGPEEATAYAPAPGEIMIANFQHAGHWWVAGLPEGAVQDVVFQSEDIPGGYGHGQIRFLLKPGKELRLIPQCAGQTQASASLRDVLFTAFGTPPAEVEHDDPGRFGQNHVAAYRFMSMLDDLKIMSASGSLHSVEQFRLRLTEEQKQRVLDTALGRSTQAGLSRMFNLLDRSCVSEALSIVDESVHYDPVRRVASGVFGHIPHFIPFYLELRGLAGPHDRLPNLRDEFPDL